MLDGEVALDTERRGSVERCRILYCEANREGVKREVGKWIDDMWMTPELSQGPGRTADGCGTTE